MTILWESYCEAVAKTKILPKTIKAYVIAQRILESLRGTTRQAVELLNFGAMMRKPELDHLAHGWLKIDRYQYAAFWSIEEEIRYYWALVHREAYYPNVDKHLGSGRDFIEYIGSRYCPPGYPGSPAHAEWMRVTGFSTYTDYLDCLLPEARRQLIKHGCTDEDESPIVESTPDPVLVGSFYITNGMLFGPNVHRRFIRNHGRHPRAPVGISIHSSACHRGESRVIVDGIRSPGILDAWDNPAEQSSAGILNCRNGEVWQAVDLDLPAWGTYGYNNLVADIEEENMDGFFPWQEALGRFIRFKGKPWEQVIQKSDLVYVGGRWCEPFTEIQILNTIGEIIALKNYFKTIQWITSHAELNPLRRSDPNPLFPMERIRLASG